MTKTQNQRSTTRRRPGRDPLEKTSQMTEESIQVGQDEHSGSRLKNQNQKEDFMAQQAPHTEHPTMAPNQQASQQEKSWDEVEAEAAKIESEQAEVFHLEFYGSELVRLKAPKLMEVAEKVAYDWVHDKDFENIQVGHPVAQIALAQSLKTAKKVEKKLEEKGVIALAKMGFEFAKSKIKK